jgi:hypothetical protein
MTEEKFKVENNTCIVSSYLIDELDYVVGGYGQPSIESLFNLNAFIEAYVLSSNFIFSTHELDHIKITSKVLFPNGRPIFELISDSKNMYVVGGIGNPIMQCVYVDKVEEKNNLTIQKAIETFQERDFERIRKTMVLSDLGTPIESVKTLTIGFGETQLIIGETTNKPFEMVKQFYDSITNYNVQNALPIFTYKQQFNELRKKAISKEIFKTICDIKGQEIKDAEAFIGGEIQALPPLVNIVLSKAKNREDIPRVMKEIRVDFTDFRICCEKFETRLNNATTIKEQIDAIKDYKVFWGTLVKKYTDKTSRIVFRFLDMAKESSYDKSLDNYMDTQNASEIIKDLNLGKVAGKAGILAWDKIKEKRILNRFKGVTDLWGLIDDTPAFDLQISNAERVFNTKIDLNRINVTREYLNAIEKTSSTTVLPERR